MKTSVWNRVGAVFIDNILIYALGIGLFVKLGMRSDQALIVMSLVFLVYSVLTPVICRGYHLGKHLLGMKIVTDGYEDPSLWQMIKREVVKLCYTIPFIGIGFLLASQYMMKMRVDGKSLHDFVAKTRVITI